MSDVHYNKHFVMTLVDKYKQCSITDGLEYHII